MRIFKKMVSILICLALIFGSFVAGIGSFTVAAYKNWEDAYLDLLLTNIDDFNYHEAKTVLIYDFLGDSTPELAYPCITEDYALRSLRIVTFDGHNVKEIYRQKEWFIFAGGSSQNCLFMLNDGRIGTFFRMSDDFISKSYKILSVNSYGISVDEEFTHYSRYDYINNVDVYKCTINGADATKDDCEEKITNLEQSVTEVLMGEVFDDNFVKPSLVEKAPGMKYDEAITYLKKKKIENQKYTIKYSDGGSDTFDHDLDYYVSKADSCKYDPDLAYMLMSIATAAYSKSTVSDMYDTLGFTEKFISSDYDIKDLCYDNKVRYSIGSKTMSNGKTLVLVDIAGTNGDLGDFKAGEWWSNLELGLFTQIASGYHQGFENAEKYVTKGLNSFLEKNKINKSSAIFVVTGHSRGAAVGNILSVKLGVKKSNLYSYNFACPDVAVEMGIYWNLNGMYDNIYNVSCNQDIVSMVPGILGDFGVIIKTNTWGKYGKSVWFCYNWSELIFSQPYFPSHEPRYYLAYFRKKKPESELKNYFEMKTAVPTKFKGKFLGFLCPVDITVTDDKGNVLATVTDNKATTNSDNLWVFTNQDHKFVFCFEDIPLNVSVKGTDKGKMTLIMKDVDYGSLTVLDEVTFNDIDISKGQVITGEWGKNVKLSDIKFNGFDSSLYDNPENSTQTSEENPQSGNKKLIIVIVVVAMLILTLIFAIMALTLYENRKKRVS